MIAKTLKEYHEDNGFVVWWKFPVNEPSWIGSPNCDDWPGYHTHWTPHPEIPINSVDKETLDKGVVDWRSWATELENYLRKKKDFDYPAVWPHVNKG